MSKLTTLNNEVEKRLKKMSAYKQQIHTKSGKVIGYDVVQKGSSYYPMVDGVTSWNQSFEDPEDALMKAREIATNYFGP